MVTPRYAAWSETRYRRKTQHFTCAAQHGIYKNLLHHQIEHGDLPSESDELRAIACANIDEWRTYWPDICDRFFKLKRGKYRNKNAAETRGRALKAINWMSTRGRNGAKKRWAKEREAKRLKALQREPELPHLNGIELNEIGGYTPEPEHVTPQKRSRRSAKIAEKKPRTASAKTRITEDWQPSPKDLEYAVSKGLSRTEIIEITIGFIRYWTGPDAAGRGLKFDWHRTWCNWIDKEFDHVIRKRRASTVGNGQKTGGVVTALNSMLARRRANGSGHVNGGVQSDRDGIIIDEAGHKVGAGGWDSDPDAGDEAAGWGEPDKSARAAQDNDEEP